MKVNNYWLKETYLYLNSTFYALSKDRKGAHNTNMI